MRVDGTDIGLEAWDVARHGRLLEQSSEVSEQTDISTSSNNEEAELDPTDWPSIVQASVKAAVAHMWAQVNAAKTTEQFKGFLPTRKGGRLRFQMNAYDYGSPAEREIEPGDRVRISSQSPTRTKVTGRAEDGNLQKHTIQPQKSTLAADVISITDKDPLTSVVTVELDEQGPVYLQGPITVRQKTPVADLKKQIELTKQLSDPDDPEDYEIDIPAPLAAFLEGDFELDPELRAYSADLDQSQNIAYGKAMAIDEQPILFIQGGPGTGKTTTICRIIEGHVNQGRKVLVVSHSNKATQVPALMLKKRNKRLPIKIAGNNPAKVDQKLHKDRLRRKLRFPVEEIRRIAGGKSNPNYGMAVKAILGQYEGSLEKVICATEHDFRNGGVAFSTLGTLLNDQILGALDFDVVIVDEATKTRIQDLLLALKKAKQQIVFVGDPEQLGNIPLTPEMREKVIESLMDPTVSEEIGRISRETAEQIADIYDEGLFSHAIRAHEQPEKHLPFVFLNQNRRSKPAIAKVLSKLMYKGKLEAGRKTEEPGTVQWIDTGNIQAAEKASGTSKKNNKEAVVIINRVLDEIRAGADPSSIAIIATYREQAENIKRLLRKKLHPTPQQSSDKQRANDFRGAKRPEKTKLPKEEILEKLLQNIGSVDSWQGAEKEIVFVSLTRSNAEGAVGFLEEERRIGVAIGRAKDKLYIVGDVKTLAEDNSNPKSREFFETMHSLVAEHGKVEEEPHRKSRRKRKKK